MAKLIGTCTDTAVTESLTTLIDWVNIQQADVFIPLMENVGGGSADDITDVQIDSSSDGGTTIDTDDDDGGITVPLSAATGFARGTFAKSDLTYKKWIRVRAKCAAGNDTTVSCWLTATSTDRLTLTELADEVRNETGTIDDTELLTATRVYKYLDWAQREIARRVVGLYDLHVESTTDIALATDTKTYSLSSLTYPICHLHRIRMIDTSSLANCRDLEFMPTDEYDRKYPYPEGLGSSYPIIYTRRGSVLEIYRIPSSDFDTLPLYLDYSKWPARLTVATDEPEITDADEVIIAGGVYRAYRAMGHAYREEAMFRRAEFDQILDQWSQQQIRLLDWPAQLYDPSDDLEV